MPRLGGEAIDTKPSIIIKCHDISQIVFVSRFMKINNRDMQNIEFICYKFLWNELKVLKDPI